jgi:hypothetical protein
MKTWIPILLNVAVAAIGVLQATDWVNLVGSDSAGLVATAIAVANMVLHYFAGTPAAAGGGAAPNAAK